MCIRDSLNTAWGLLSFVLPRRTVMVRRGRIFHWRRAQQEDGTCLLYTSDAADERSSVDLGGRRIIKKKKRTALDAAGLSSTTKERVEQQNNKKHTERRI